jgi:hypothetical protein
MANAKVKSDGPTLFLVVEYDTDDMAIADIFEYSRELIEKARETGRIVSAKMINIPSEMELE